VRFTVVAMLFALVSNASAADRRGRRMVVNGETLQVSPELKQRVLELTRRADWDGAFKQQESDWKEATRFRRLPRGETSDETMHVGRRPTTDHGFRWMIRLAEEHNGPAARSHEVASKDTLDGFRLSVERVGAHLASVVAGATKLPNGRTLEVNVEVVEAKRQVSFEVHTWKGATRGKRLPSGRFVVRDVRGVVVARGDVRALWRIARSADGRWATRALGLRNGELQELLVDLTN
jgi:hypothetical protein